MRSEKGQLQFSSDKEGIWFIIRLQEKDDSEESFFYDRHFDEAEFITNNNFVREDMLIYKNGEKL